MAKKTGPLTNADGVTTLELVLMLALVGLLTSLAAPVTAQSIDSSRARSAAGFVAARFRLARDHASSQSASVGLVFDAVGPGWTFRVCVDGNGNGLRRTDISSGTDTCPEGPYELGRLFPGIQLAVDANLRGPDGEAGSPDPVRFGRSNIASFAPEGTGSAGTVFVRSARGNQYAIRVGNITGRVRILRYEPGARTWRPA